MKPLSTTNDLTPGAALFISLICVLFGANGVAIKIGFSGFGIFFSAVVRFLMASIAITLWARLTRRCFRITVGQLGQLAVFALLFTVQLTCFYIGLSHTTASRGALITNLLPFLVLLLSHFFTRDEKISVRLLLGMLLGFSGVLCLFAESGLSAKLYRGDGLVLGATIIWACNTIYLKRIIHTFDPFQVVLYSMMLAMPLFWMEAVLLDPVFIYRPSAGSIGALLYQGLVSASFGFVAWNQMIARYGAVAVNSFVFLMPLTGVLTGWLLLNEPLSANVLAALVLIAIGLMTTHVRPSQAPAFPTKGEIS